jgi:hypothetical protein
MKHFDEDLESGVSARLSAELNTLFKPQLPVPPEVDRAVSDLARKHFVRRESRKGERRRFRWVGLWRIAAAAAVIIFAFSLDLTKKPEKLTVSSVVAEARAIDIDRNGRVDILDAFKLARQIESASRAETNLSLRKRGWDMNGDGLVNRNDVDLVASAAVRLDKGVL